ncbi:MAG: GNAT family N-acetyltransferase [Lachnospiraceae bacterium]|nr:GNAT family N-acetyltransferase [Lachnospiraceae bacterium]
MTTYYNDGTVKVRSMVATDAKTIYDTYLSYGWHPSIETYETYLKEQEAGERLVFIAEYEDAVKGLCTLVLNPSEGPWGGQKIPEIVDLCVFFDIHGKGIGNKLLDVAEAEAAKICDTVFLAVGVHSGYGPAQRIYVKRGYNFDGSGVWYQGKQLDQYAPCVNDYDLLLFMSKKLNDKKRQGESEDYAERNDKRKSLLETTLNTRDLGGYRVEGTENFTKFNRFIRSDAPTMPSERDIDFLRRNGITTIIDTRIDEEIERKAHGLSKVEGFDYYNFPISEGSGLPESVEKVPDSYFACAHDPSIAKIFKTIAEADGAVMYNCSAGKDRTGVNSALILWLCGVSKDDIVRDYMYTKENNASRFGRIRENFPDIDINIVIPHEEYMYGFIDLMEKAHGTIEAFFESIGIDASVQKKLRSKLLDA